MINKKKVEKGIKKHEGFSNKTYLDKFGNLTIGYGHLVKKSDKFKEGIKYKKKHLNSVFKKDFLIAQRAYENIFKKDKLPTPVTGVLVEMLFQIGKLRFNKFKKMIGAIKNKNYKKASKEMINSKWYIQTPKRVRKLSNIMKKADDKKK